MSLVLHPDLVAHFQKQGVRLPKRTLLYEYRLNCDYASMLWAREFLFSVSPGAPIWHTHLRIDSSPQFNKNYLVGELDRICVEQALPDNLDNVFLGPNTQSFPVFHSTVAAAAELLSVLSDSFP